jgi:hypothetical protein
VPTVEEAVERLRRLRVHGPSPSAFGFRDMYTPADAGLGGAHPATSRTKARTAG